MDKQEIIDSIATITDAISSLDQLTISKNKQRIVRHLLREFQDSYIKVMWYESKDLNKETREFHLSYLVERFNALQSKLGENGYSVGFELYLPKEIKEI